MNLAYVVISKQDLSLSFLKYNLRGRKQLLITNLPEYYNGCYTEKDLADFLIPFGFQYTDDNLHIVPLSGMVGAGL